MLKNEREQEILATMKHEGGFVTVDALAKKLYASESSIRRDLALLEKKGVVRRSYGGAELVSGLSNVIAFRHRSHENSAAKREIAAKAAGLIADDSVIFLDQSSTAFYLANEIVNRSSLTVVTNNIEIVNLLAPTNLRLVVSGGVLSRDNRSCLIGRDAEACFEGIFADILFFSAKALSDEGVISDCTSEEVHVRNAMRAHADTCVFLCDSGKLHTHAAYRQCDLGDVDYLICEGDHAKEFSTRFENLHCL